MIRLCAFDLDGTLLTSGRIMTEKSAAALRDLYGHGCSVAIVTGRPPCFAEAYLLQAGIKGYVAASNGSWISAPSGEIIYLHEFPSSLTAGITGWLAGRGSRFGVQFRDRLVGNLDLAPDTAARFTVYREMASRYGLFPELPLTDPSLSGKAVEGVLKISVTADREGIPACLEEMERKFPGLETAMSGASVGDVSLAGDGKGSAVRRIADHLGISRESICSFGDYDNDIPMFRESGISVAMNNATEKVRESAAHITYDNDSEGIAEAVGTLLMPGLNDTGGGQIQ